MRRLARRRRRGAAMRTLGLAASLLLAAACTTPSAVNTGQPPTQRAPGASLGDEAGSSASTATSFAAIKLSGHGNKVPKFKVPEDAAAIAKIGNSGGENFVVTSLG